MIRELKESIERWELIVKSIPLLRELRSYTSQEIREVHFDEDASSHFDRVMAIAIANQMKFELPWYTMPTRLDENWRNNTIYSSLQIRKTGTKKRRVDFEI